MAEEQYQQKNLAQIILARMESIQQNLNILSDQFRSMEKYPQTKEVEILEYLTTLMKTLVDGTEKTNASLEALHQAIQTPHILLEIDRALRSR